MRKDCFPWVLLIFSFLLHIPLVAGSVPEVPVKTGTIAVGEMKLYYEEAGKGFPLVMLHGGGLDCRMWDGQFQFFARKFRVIRYDARNHGRSVGVPGLYAHHDDLKALLDGLSIKKAVVMGLSMGGYVTIDFNIRYPDRVAAIIPVAPGLTGYEFKSKEYALFIEKYRKAIEGGDTGKRIESFLESWTDGPRRTPAQVNPAVRNKVKEMALSSAKSRNRQSRQKRLDPPASGRLSEIKVPTLVVLGDLDMPGIVEIAEMIAGGVKGAKKVVIKGTAHMVNMEKPEAFNRVVMDFLQQLKL